MKIFKILIFKCDKTLWPRAISDKQKYTNGRDLFLYKLTLCHHSNQIQGHKLQLSLSETRAETSFFVKKQSKNSKFSVKKISKCQKTRREKLHKFDQKWPHQRSGRKSGIFYGAGLNFFLFFRYKGRNSQKCKKNKVSCTAKMGSGLGREVGKAFIFPKYVPVCSNLVSSISSWWHKVIYTGREKQPHGCFKHPRRLFKTATSKSTKFHKK